MEKYIFYLIPTSNFPNYFAISLFGKQYVFTFTWNTLFSYWIIDIDDGGGNKLVYSTPLVTGINLMRQYGYLNLPPLFSITSYAPELPPNANNLGLEGQLWTFAINPTAIQ